MSDDTPDTNFKVIDTRSPETRARVAGDHVPDARKKVEETLATCPFCGGEAVVRHFENVSFYVSCKECNAGIDTESSRGDAIAAWNHRAPEPMTSVVRWTRVDGTLETLPEEGVAFFLVCNGLLLRQSYSFHSGAGQHEVVGDILPSPRNFKVGDLWAYLPLPPEGME